MGGMRRRAPLLLLVVAAAGLAGCAARPRGAGPRGVEARGGDGWARLPTGASLRGDTPALADVLPAPAPEAAPSRDFGPGGEAGVTSGGSVAWYPGPEPTLLYGLYLTPGGAVPPGLRPPSDVVSPYAAPYRTTFPSSDVARHRPGLSTGSGPFGRRAPDDPAPRPR